MITSCPQTSPLLIPMVNWSEDGLILSQSRRIRPLPISQNLPSPSEKFTSQISSFLPNGPPTALIRTHWIIPLEAQGYDVEAPNEEIPARAKTNESPSEPSYKASTTSAKRVIDAPDGEQRYSSDGMPTPRSLNPEPSRQGGRVVGVNMQMVAGVYPRRHQETDEKQDQYHKNYDRISNNDEQKQKGFSKSMIYSPLSGPYPDMGERTTQTVPKEEEHRRREDQRKENRHDHEEKPGSREENERGRGHPDRRPRPLEESEDNHSRRRPDTDQDDRQNHVFTPIRGPPQFFGFPKGFFPEGDQREEDRDRRGRRDKDQREAEGEGRHADRDGRFESHPRGKGIHEGKNLKEHIETRVTLKQREEMKEMLNQFRMGMRI
ncbi:hypothetical protein WR25_12675 [Diploscapter pachys]|uniref:Uncharacterized protein n=1 Tax=Diploscapter pachys TaxID=2018661 RepID=A0A2A2LC80_9BILA|nr:hypothetical protein WR25_12675 [Diploscapter pachys]